MFDLVSWFKRKFGVTMVSIVSQDNVVKVNCSEIANGGLNLFMSHGAAWHGSGKTGIVTVDFSQITVEDVQSDIATMWPANADANADANANADAGEITEDGGIKSITRFEPYVTDELERSALFLRMLWGFHKTGFWASPEQFETKFCRKDGEVPKAPIPSPKYAKYLGDFQS